MSCYFGYIIFIRFIDTIHTAFCLVVIYHYIIVDYGNIRLIENMIWHVPIYVLAMISYSVTSEFRIFQECSCKPRLSCSVTRIY